jgi:hypothetical protein
MVEKIGALVRSGSGRRITRTWGSGLTALGLLLAAGQAKAGLIKVGGACSLADAIHAANTDAAVGGCAKGNGADTITLQPNSTFLLTAADNPDRGGVGLPVVTSTITIEGHGSIIERDRTVPDFGLIHVDHGDLTLNDTTLSFGAPGPGGEGGAIQTYYAALTLNDCFISGNEVTGVSDRGSDISINRTTLNASGIGLVTVFGDVFVSNSAVTANDDGGVFAASAGVTFDNTTISLNGGTGCFATQAGVTLRSSTISGNVGTGLVLDFGYVASISQTIIAGNGGVGAREVELPEGPAVDDHNIFGFSGDPGVVGFVPSSSDIIPSGPLSSVLAPLGANGGPTLTHLIVVNGPAQNASPSCLESEDQRGVARPQGAACDIGAVELIPDPCQNHAPTSGCTVNGVSNQPCVGTTGNDLIYGTGGNDFILGLLGDDIIVGGSGNDVLCGGPGGDFLNGGGGDDQLFGGAGNDTLSGDHGADSVVGGAGRDTCATDASDVNIQTCP